MGDGWRVGRTPGLLSFLFCGLSGGRLAPRVGVFKIRQLLRESVCLRAVCRVADSLRESVY